LAKVTTHEPIHAFCVQAMTDPKDPAIQFVAWAVVHKHLNLFANHGKILENVACKLDAHWD
jgi:hypothetical protein